MRHLLSSFDLTPAQSNRLVHKACALRDGRGLDLGGLVAALFFFQPSLRTRLSMESAMARFGGSATSMTPGADTWRFGWRDGETMDGEEQEHVRELAPVVSRLAHVAGIRCASRIGGSGGVQESYGELARDPFLHRFAEHASVPVINMESNRWHPLQGLADQMTIAEALGETRAQRYVLTWAWHPGALPVATPHSQLVAACDLGLDVVLLRPPGWGLEPEVLERARGRAEAQGGSLTESSEPDQALRGARVVCVKSWGRLDRYGSPQLAQQELTEKEPLRHSWLFDGAKMALTDEAMLLHCLPLRRNVVVADEVLDGPQSAVITEGENRLWTAAAVLAELLGR